MSEKEKLTATDFTIAKRNGISEAALRSRIKSGWEKERAITEPIRKKSVELEEKLKIADKNGIPRKTALNRIYNSSWDVDRAVTEPVKNAKRGNENGNKN